jgi:DNA polymerase III subunit alpha
MQLSSKSFIEGFYYTPRIDKEILRQHSEGLIALSACLGGEIPQAILKNNLEQADLVISEYKEIFGDDFYLEIQRHGMADQELVIPKLLALSEKHNVKIVASNDVHFIDSADAEAHNVMICLNTRKDIDSEELLRYTGQEYCKTPEEMTQLFADIPQAISNISHIIQKIEQIDITHPVVLPSFRFLKDTPTNGNTSSTLPSKALPCDTRK